VCIQYIGRVLIAFPQRMGLYFIDKTFRKNCRRYDTIFRLRYHIEIKPSGVVWRAMNVEDSENDLRYLSLFIGERHCRPICKSQCIYSLHNYIVRIICTFLFLFARKENCTIVYPFLVRPSIVGFVVNV
jgi:hypothetical protein